MKINQHAIVETNLIGVDVQIAEFAIVRSGVIIGDGVIIHPHVVINSGVTIGPGVEIFPGAYVGKEPKGAGATSRPISFTPHLEIGRNSSIGPNSVLYYDVILGENTLVGDSASIREGSRIGSRCIIGRHVTVNYATLIGDRVKIMDHTWLAGNMTIGNDVFISGGVLTANDNQIGEQGYSEDKVIGPKIEDGVRIGAGAILLPGVVIHQRAIIAAGAVVTKDVASNDLVMGIPAKFVRKMNQNISEIQE
jgi:acetyltransferase-like isoleucine patch superfamily enzyme